MPQPYKLQSSVNGRIQKLLLVYDGSPEERQVLQQTIIEFARKFSQTAQIFITTNRQRDSNEIKNYLQANHISVLEANQQTGVELQAKCIIIRPKQLGDYNIWTRDPMVMFSNGTEYKYLESTLNRGRNSRLDNADLADKLEKDFRLLSRYDTPNSSNLNWFVIDGGDIIADDKHVLIGGYQLPKVLQSLGNGTSIAHPKNAIKHLKNLFGKEVFIIGFGSGDSSSEIIHGMSLEAKKLPFFISASPEIFKLNHWADQQKEKTKNRSIPNNFDTQVSPIYGSYVHIDLFLNLTGHSNTILLAEVHDVQNDGLLLENELNELQEELELAGFTVRRNKVLHLTDPTLGRYTLYFNNCLIEQFPNGNKRGLVWLPNFETPDISLRKLINECKEDNKNHWNYLNYEVKFIDADFSVFKGGRGAVRCLTAELERT